MSTRASLGRTGWWFFCQSAQGGSGSGTTTLIVPIPGHVDEEHDDDDIYIMMQCLCVCLSRKMITSHFRAERRRRKVTRLLGLAGRRPALA